MSVMANESHTNDSFSDFVYTYNETLIEEDIYSVPVGVVVLLAILYGSISLIAVLGNGLVIFVISKNRKMQTVTNIFIANLALADVIIGLFSTPFQFQPALHQRWDLPRFLCKVAPSFKVLSVNVSVFTLAVISVDRYMAVLYPFKAGFSKKMAFLGIALIWIIGIASSFPEALYFSFEYVYDVTNGGLKPYCNILWPTKNFGKYYHLYLFIVQYLLPLLVINFSYIRIACRIWGTKQPGDATETDNVRQRNKRKVVKMLIVVVCLFVVCWMPLQIYGVLSEIYVEVNDYKYINIIWFCSNWLAMSNSCYNPFIYGLLNEKFKLEYRLLFSKSRCLKKLTGDPIQYQRATIRTGMFYGSDTLLHKSTRCQNGFLSPGYTRTSDQSRSLSDLTSQSIL